MRKCDGCGKWFTGYLITGDQGYEYCAPCYAAIQDGFQSLNEDQVNFPDGNDLTGDVATHEDYVATIRREIATEKLMDAAYRPIHN